LRVEREDLLVRPDRGVRPPFLLVLIREREELLHEVVAHLEQLGRDRVELEQALPGRLDAGSRELLCDREAEMPVERVDQLVAVADPLGPPGAQLPRARCLRVALERALDVVARGRVVLRLESGFRETQRLSEERRALVGGWGAGTEYDEGKKERREGG